MGIFSESVIIFPQGIQFFSDDQQLIQMYVYVGYQSVVETLVYRCILNV